MLVKRIIAINIMLIKTIIAINIILIKKSSRLTGQRSYVKLEFKLIKRVYPCL